MLKEFRIISLIVFMAVAACGSAGAGPTATGALQAETPAPASPAAGPLLEFNGDTFASSPEFQIDAAATIDVAWDYSGTGPFAIWIVNTDDFNAAPPYDRIIVVDTEGASAGSTKIDLIPGTYVVEVELAEGPWSVSAAVAQ